MYLRVLASDLGGSGQSYLSPFRGTASANRITNTVASGTSIQMTDSAGGTPQSYFTAPLKAVTLSGNIGITVHGLESNALANATGGIKIERCDNSGAVISTILTEQNVAAGGSEYGTTNTTLSQASVAITSTSLSNGDRIKVTLTVLPAGGTTMGGSQTVTNTIDGPTPSAAGDTFVTFAETIETYNTYVNTAEGGTNTTAVTAANSGGASGTPFAVPTGTVTFDNSHPSNGSMGYKCVSSGSPSYLPWTTPGAVRTKTYFRVTVYVTANPAFSSKVWAGISLNGTVCASVLINSSGKVFFQSAAGSQIGSVITSNSVNLNGFTRIEGFVIGDPSVGQVELKLFLNKDSATPDETLTSLANVNTTGQISRDWFGISNSVTYTEFLDDIGSSGVGYLGPQVISSTGSIRMHKMGLSATGSEKVSATVSIGMHKMGLSASGTVTATSDTGTGSIRMHKMGLSATGLEKVSATGSIRMHKMGLSAAGLEKVSATGSIRMHKMGISAAGLEKVSATGSIRMHKMGLSASGTVHVVVLGSGSVRLHKMSLSASGTAKAPGTGSVRMHKMSLSSVGTAQEKATGSIAMYKMNIRGTNVRPLSSNLFLFTAV
jgi:hypothetical protein